MNTEDVIREILSKICSLHGKHPGIEIEKDWQLNISACCPEFHEQMENIARDLQKKGDEILSLK